MGLFNKMDSKMVRYLKSFNLSEERYARMCASGTIDQLKITAEAKKALMEAYNGSAGYTTGLGKGFTAADVA